MSCISIYIHLTGMPGGYFTMVVTWKIKSTSRIEKFFVECSQYFSRMRLTVFYNVIKFQSPNCNTFWDMNYCPVWVLVKSTCQLEKFFKECTYSQYFSRIRLVLHCNVVKFRGPNCNTFWDMNYCPIWILVRSSQTDGQKVTHMSPPCKVHRWAQKGLRLTYKQGM